MEGEVPGKREPGKCGSAVSVLRKVCQGVVIGVIVGVLGNVLIRITGLGSPPIWVFAIVGALVALAYDLIVQKVKLASQKDG